MSYLSHLHYIFFETLDHVLFFLVLVHIFSTENARDLLNSCWFNLINLV